MNEIYGPPIVDTKERMIAFIGAIKGYGRFRQQVLKFARFEDYGPADYPRQLHVDRFWKDLTARQKQTIFVNYVSRRLER